MSPSNHLDHTANAAAGSATAPAPATAVATNDQVDLAKIWPVDMGQRAETVESDLIDHDFLSATTKA